MKTNIAILFLLTIPAILTAQNKKQFAFNGQLSTFGSYAPDNKLKLHFGARYIPELSYTFPIDSTKKIDFFLSANMFGNAAINPFDSTHLSGAINPYRVWARYSGKQFEIRMGLQKIDFGSATLLRPLQWFNQVNPRDPLGITDGVYALLGRYYFLNNANIWLWALYGNQETKGFEVIPTRAETLEAGGRIQYPIPRGELGVSYHYRTATIPQRSPLPFSYEKIPEHRYGIDIKLDLTVGIWIEASQISKRKNLNIFTNQTLISTGVNYTFGVGNGITATIEHLIGSSDNKAFQFQNTKNITATTITYPISFFDNLLTVATYNWEEEVGSLFMSYEHIFKKISGYIMLFYTPKTTMEGLVRNAAEYAISGPGIRFMIVYNH